MKTMDFYPKTFNQIENNPAFGNIECLMIVKESNKCNHSVVLNIRPQDIKLGDTVTSIAKFWRHDLAINYCNNIKGGKVMDISKVYLGLVLIMTVIWILKNGG